MTTPITTGSGTYEVIWERVTDANDVSPDFKPIASAEDGGLVKFFGRVDDGHSGSQMVAMISKVSGLSVTSVRTSRSTKT